MKILLIEDNNGDVELIKEVFSAKGFIIEFIVAYDAEQASNILGKIIKGEVVPSLIILDINIPKGGGFRVLEAIRANEATKLIPVIVFSTSKRQEDIRKSYELLASCYIAKPFEFGEMLRVAELINDFWLRTIELPI